MIGVNKNDMSNEPMKIVVTLITTYYINNCEKIMCKNLWGVIFPHQHRKLYF